MKYLFYAQQHRFGPPAAFTLRVDAEIQRETPAQRTVHEVAVLLVWAIHPERGKQGIAMLGRGQEEDPE